MKKYNVGIIGSGAISGNYLKFAKQAFSDYYTITMLADLDPERAKAKAEQYEVEKWGTTEELLADPSIDLVINLTVPAAHEEVTLKALAAGKHVYSEKPLALDLEGIRRIEAKAKEVGKVVACAPDSFLNNPFQSARKCIEDGWIGKPVGFSAICTGRGNELWRPDSDFFYQKGAGPLMDMGGYYMNVFVSLLGPVESVMSMNKMTFPERTIKAAPRRGEKIKVEVPTHVVSLIKFENGVMGTFTDTWDVWSSNAPHIEIYGTKGSMVLVDPNRYKGDILVKRMDEAEYRVVEPFKEYELYGRGIGIMDMIRHIEEGTELRASTALAYHVTDVILSLEKSAAEGREVKVESTVKQPAGLYEYEEPMYY